MPDQRTYLYVVSNMLGCVLGVSDYGFNCGIHATSEDEAELWGHKVTTEYAARFGFRPHGMKPAPDEIRQNAFVMNCDDASRADHECAAGSFPSVLH